ncbi:MAG: hypothetical protein QXU32_03025 [Nitrososphaerales archaeon]
MRNTQRCKKHTEPMPLFPCKIFGNVTVGYYCVACHDFIAIPIVPEVDVLNKLIETCRNGTFERSELQCAQ